MPLIESLNKKEIFAVDNIDNSLLLETQRTLINSGSEDTQSQVLKLYLPKSQAAKCSSGSFTFTHRNTE